MKIETGSLTISGAGPYYLEDDTLSIKLLILISGKDATTGSNLSIGITDGNADHERAISSLYDTSKKTDFATVALLHYLNVSGTATKKIDVSDVDLSTAGEFSFGTVTNYDASIPIMFIAIGE
jgi:hypothetical protein